MPAINWLSIVIATLIPMVVGFIWYHQKVFGQAWMKAVGLTPEDAKKSNMGLIFGVSLVMAFLLSFFLLFNVNGAGQEGVYDTFKHGALHGVVVALMIAMPVMVTNGLYEQRKWSGMLINLGYWAVALGLMGGVLDAMNHFPNELLAQ